MEVIRKFLHITDILRFLYHHHLMLGHHRITLGGINNSSYIHICPVYNGQVELLFRFGQNIVCYIVGNEIDVIGFLAHKIIDGTVLLRSQFL